MQFHGELLTLNLCLQRNSYSALSGYGSFFGSDLLGRFHPSSLGYVAATNNSVVRFFLPSPFLFASLTRGCDIDKIQKLYTLSFSELRSYCV